jgi:hypothetical protein
MRNALRLGALGILSVLLVTGCGARGVRIVQLQNDYERYDDRTISVQGIVTDSWGIPLVPFQLYKVDDGTGEITVLSRSGRAPSKGVRVRVKGKINEFGNFGGRSIGLHIQENDRKITS